MTIDELSERVATLDSVFGHNMDVLVNVLRSMDTRLERIDGRLDSIEKRLNRIESCIFFEDELKKVQTK